MKQELSQTPSAIRSRKWRSENPEKHRANIRAGYWANPEKNKAEVRTWRKANPDKLQDNRDKNFDPLVAYMYQAIYNMAFPEIGRARRKRWDIENKEHRAAWTKKWNLKNADKVKARKKKNYDRKYNSDPVYKIQLALRSRLWKTTSQACVGKVGKTMDVLGCSIGRFMEYLQAHFQPGMNFGNYGEWHIDHIKPVSKFDLSDPEQQRACFNWLNLQPLWEKDNLVKSNKLPQSTRESCEAQNAFA